MVFHLLLLVLWACCFTTFQPTYPGQVYGAFITYKIYIIHMLCFYHVINFLFISFFLFLSFRMFYCLLWQGVIQMNRPRSSIFFLLLLKWLFQDVLLGKKINIENKKRYKASYVRFLWDIWYWCSLVMNL